MPIYSYRCASCAAEFELLVKISSDTVPACPQCAGTDLTQLLSRIAPAGKTAGLVANARQQAAKEGHFSNYSKAERKSILKS